MRKEKLRKFEFVATGLVVSMMLICVFSARAFASFAGDIYIRADGSIDPSNAPIATSDNVTYVLTADVSGTLTIQRDNIVFDGAGYTFTGSGAGYGITLYGSSNVTIKDTTIQNFNIGISLAASSGNTLSGNNVANNSWGILLDYYSSGNTVSGNNVTANNGPGIEISGYSDNNTVSGNNAADNQYGIYCYLSSDNTLSGNNVANNGFGIYLDDSSNNNVLSGNNVTSNTADGIDIFNSSSNNTLSGNNVTANAVHGIHLYGSPSNTLLDNNVVAYNGYGIWLYSSSDNTLSGNNVANSQLGIYLAYSSGNTVSGNNIANNGEGILLHSSSGNTVSGNNATNNGFGILLSASSLSNTVSGNNVTYNYWGIDLSYSFDSNTVSGNTVADNQYGIFLYSSSDNTLASNNVTASSIAGIYLYSSSSNTISHNWFVNNVQQVSSDGSPNTWDNGYPSGGNCWSNHTDRDVFSGPYQNQTGSDGIGDNPYVIDANNTDNYPLMKAFPWSEHDIGITYIGRVYSFNLVTPLKTLVGLRFSMNISTFVMNYGNQTETFSVQVYANDTLVDTFANVTLASRQSATLELSWNTTGLAYGNYTIRAVADNLSGETDTSDNTYTNGMVYVGLPGDMNGDGKVDIRDIAYLAKRFGANPRSSIWNPNADLNDDGKIDIRDIAIAAKHFGEHM